MKKFKKQLVTPVVFLISGVAAGLLLLLKPGAMLDAVIRIAGWALIIDGAIKAIQLFMEGKRRPESYLAPGLRILAGAAFMLIARFLVGLIPFVFGLVLITLGAYKLKTALFLKGRDAERKQWIIVLFLAIASATIGVYVLVHPSAFTDTVLRILGGYLLIECAQDLYAYWVSR